MLRDYEPEFCECDGEECCCGLESEDDYTMRTFHETIIESEESSGLSPEEDLRKHVASAKELAQCLAVKIISEDDDALAILIKNISKEDGIPVEEVTQRMFF